MLLLSLGKILQLEGLNIQPTCRTKGKEGLGKPKQLWVSAGSSSTSLKRKSTEGDLWILHYLQWALPIYHFFSRAWLPFHTSSPHQSHTHSFCKTWTFWIPQNKIVASSSEFLPFFILYSFFIQFQHLIDYIAKILLSVFSQLNLPIGLGAQQNWECGTHCVLFHSEHLIQNW